jgi:adenylyltransferase/sulfurtransferase
MGLTKQEIKRYARHIILPEVRLDGQEKLKNSSVLIIGAGGLGSPVAMYLAAAGVGTLGIVDFDTVDESNLQRQIIHKSSDIGKSKTESAAKTLYDINPHIKLNLYSYPISPENAFKLIEPYDIIADGTDNFQTRYLINDACVLLGKPNVYSSILQFDGQASVFWNKRGPCYRCLFPVPPEEGTVPSCSEAGVFGVLPGVMGSIQATEVIKLLLDIGEPLIGKLLLYDALDMTFEELQLKKNPDCPICGSNPSITELQVENEVCATTPLEQTTVKPDELTPLELEKAISEKKEIYLLDVREPYETEICKIPGSVNIPMGTVSDKLDELPNNTDIVVICHKGIRSRTITDMLKESGFIRVFNLTGGVDRYSVDVDLKLERY